MRSAKRPKRDAPKERYDDGTNHNTNKVLRTLLQAVEAFTIDEEDGNHDGTHTVFETLTIQDVQRMQSKIGYIDGLLAQTLSSKLAKEEDEEEQSIPKKKMNHDDDTVPAEVVRHVSQSGYLDTVDLGRFVLFTKRSFLGHLTPNLFYKEVFKSRYRYLMLSNNNEKDLDRFAVTYMERAGGSYERALHNFERHPECKRDDPKPPEPTWLGEWEVPEAVLSSGNIILVASIWANSRNIFSTRLSQIEVIQLMETHDGYRLTIPDRSNYKSAAWYKMIDVLGTELAQEKKKLSDELENDSLTWDEKKRLRKKGRPLPSSWPICKIHCIRTDTNQICAIYDSSSSKEHLNGRSFDGREAGSLHRYEDFFPWSFPLLLTDLGHRYLGRWTNSKDGNVFKKGGMQFYACNELHELNVTFHVNIGVGWDYGYIGAPTKPTDESRTIKRNRVTMYHILEELEAWNY